MSLTGSLLFLALTTPPSAPDVAEGPAPAPTELMASAASTDARGGWCTSDFECTGGLVCEESACQEPTGCISDIECDGDNVCLSGSCQLPPGQRRAASTPSTVTTTAPATVAPAVVTPATATASNLEVQRTAPARSGSADSTANIHVNSLGVFQYGLAPTLEFGKRFAGNVKFRLPNTGVLPYVLAKSEEEDDEFVWGLGLGGGVRGYFSKKGNMRGFYLGGTLEYLYTKTRDEVDDRAEYITHGLVPGGQLGYRWVWGRFLMSVGAQAGVMLPIASKDRPLGSDGCFYGDDISCPNQRGPSFVGGLVLELGGFFRRR